MSNLILSVRRPALILALFITGFLFLTLPFFRPDEVPFIFLFIGRLHPLILHFPIVLIILALLFEVAGRYYRMKVGENTVMVLLAAAALSALVSIAAGFFLFASGEYSGNLMERHFWAGAVTGAAIFITLGLFYIYRKTTRYYYLYFGGLLLTNAAVGYTSHLGGSITHGQDYLTEHLQFVFHVFDREEVKTESEMLVYEDMINPIFEAKCMSCHNAQRAKGEFLLTTYKDMLKGGESGHPSITPGNPEESEVFKRVILPEDHSDRMPPEGKTPLMDSEIALLKFWVASGATDTLKVVEAQAVDTMTQVVKTILPELVKYRRRARIEKVRQQELEEELQQLATRLDIVIRRDSLSDENLFAISMKFPPAPFTNEQFRELSPYFEVFSKASLISSGIDDAGLYYIGQMVNLRELYLQKTGVDGSGILYLQKLPLLEILNLSFTKVDDKSVIDLLAFSSLREVYLYRTNTSMQVIEALRKFKPEVRFLLEEGPYF
ncbi:MAG: c-type cytochrome domain-containing protein [Cyclobacteriaceae bacterium]